MANFFLSTDPFFISTAVSKSLDPISELFGIVASKNGQKYFVPTNPLLNSSAVSESIEPILGRYGLN